MDSQTGNQRPLDLKRSPIQTLLAAELTKVPETLRLYRRDITSMFREVLPHLGDDAIEGFLPQFVANSLRNTLIRNLNKLGRSHLVHCVNPDELLRFQREGRPVICAFSHLGAARGVLHGLAGLGINALGMQWASNQPTRALSLPGIELVDATPDSPETTLFLKRAVDRLRRGGLVFLAIDGRLGQKPHLLSCIGREMPFSRGIYALQKATDAAVIMVTARWRADQWQECIFEPAITNPDQFTPAFSANWLEKKILGDPSQVTIEKLHIYRKLPFANLSGTTSNTTTYGKCTDGT